MAQVRYYNMIHERAKATYNGPAITVDNYSIWVDHWIAAAKAIRDEFAAEGLKTTSSFVQDIINSSSRYIQRPAPQTTEITGQRASDLEKGAAVGSDR